MDCLWLAVVVIAFGMCHLTDGGCAGKCCQGTDISCQTTDWRMDRTYGTCYCDVSCHRTKDCCFDHPVACPAVPCLVSEWSYWSGCAQPCRRSYRVRRRHIEREPQNSDEPCPPLQEQAGCMEYHDHQGQICALPQGPALITTMEFGKGRAAHNLYGDPVDSGFCMEFKLETLTPQCMAENRPNTRWMQYLREGFTICVACQPPAMLNSSRSCIGDGSDSDRDELLRWEAVGSPRCRGTWRKLHKQEHCTCPQVHSFIFT